MGAAAIVALAAVMSLAPAAAAADAPANAAEELSLSGLGMAAQTVYGTQGAVEVSFPPPAARLTPSGSFVRLSFSHSQPLGAGSSLLLAVNGQPLTSVALDSGTAGGVFEVRLPGPLLDDRQPNWLQMRFELRPAAGAATTAYGRVESSTLIHYELAGAGGALPGLEAYPYSLLAAGAPSQPIGLVLPLSPGPEEMAPALRLLADLGRRAASQRVRPQVVTADQLTWLAAGGTGALLVGPVDRLPAAPAVLGAAGWRRTAAGWTGPGGGALKPDDGLLVTALSPWDRRSQLLLVTGGTTAAVSRAAAALVDGPPLAGLSAVVGEAVSGGGQMPGSVVRLSLPGPRALGGLGTGRFRAAMGFTAPAVDADDLGLLEVTVPALGPAMPPSTVEADLNGSRVAGATLALGGTRPTQLRASFPGRLLRPGRNAFSIEIRVAAGSPSAAGSDHQGGPTATGDDLTSGTIELPPSRPTAPDLRLLPFPFLDGPWTPQVLLGDGTAGTLTAAAQAMVALGSRLAGPPRALPVAYASGWNPEYGGLAVIVIGPLPGDGPVGSLSSRFPVVFDRSGQAVLSRGAGSQVRLSTSLGAIEELGAAGPGDDLVLWVGGTGPDALASAAAALYDVSLSGSAQLVDLGGRAWSPATGGEVGPATGPGIAALAAALAAVLVLATLTLQLVRPKRSVL